jgi:hypothetical protein
VAGDGISADESCCPNRLWWLSLRARMFTCRVAAGEPGGRGWEVSDSDEGGEGDDDGDVSGVRQECARSCRG